MFENLKAKVEKETDLETEPKAEDLDFHTFHFIKGGHIDIPDLFDFSPEKELKRIREAVKKLPKSTQSVRRTVLMDDYRRNLKIFRERLAQAQLALENLIRENPDNYEKIRNGVSEILATYNMEPQSKIFYGSIERYWKAHKAIMETIQKFKTAHKDGWQKPLFEALFGKEPQGEIEVVVLPLSVFFKISNLEDYFQAYIDPKEDKNKGKERARTSGGSFLRSRNFIYPALNQKVFLENLAVGQHSSKFQEIVKIHEEEHLIHSNFFPSSLMIKQESEFNHLCYNVSAKETNTEKLIRALRLYTRFFIRMWQGDAKSEVLAYWKAQKYLSKNISNELLKENGLYDYLKNWSENNFVQNVLKHLKSGNIKILSNQGEPLNEEEVKEVAITIIREAWESYKKDLTLALDAVAELERIYGNKEDARLQILRLLSQEPLDKWHRLSKILS